MMRAVVTALLALAASRAVAQGPPAGRPSPTPTDSPARLPLAGAPQGPCTAMLHEIALPVRNPDGTAATGVTLTLAAGPSRTPLPWPPALPGDVREGGTDPVRPGGRIVILGDITPWRPAPGVAESIFVQARAGKRSGRITLVVERDAAGCHLLLKAGPEEIRLR